MYSDSLGTTMDHAGFAQCKQPGIVSINQ